MHCKSHMMHWQRCQSGWSSGGEHPEALVFGELLTIQTQVHGGSCSSGGTVMCGRRRESVAACADESLVALTAPWFSLCHLAGPETFPDVCSHSVSFR